MFSTTTEYALRAVVFLAKQSPRYCTTEQISEATKVPSAYLSKVLQSLRDAGLVQSKRGSGGGVSFQGDTKTTNILEIVNAVDPFQRVKRCPLGIPEHLPLCPLHRRLDEAISYVENILGRPHSIRSLSKNSSNTTVAPSLVRVPIPSSFPRAV